MRIIAFYLFFILFSPYSEIYAQQWSKIGGGIPDQPVASMEELKGELFLHGVFFRIGDIVTNHFVSWDGFNWKNRGDTFDIFLDVMSYGVYHDTIYVGGNWFDFNSTPIDAHATVFFDGTQWFYVPGTSEISGGNKFVFSICLYNNRLYFGGNFYNLGGMSVVNNIASWDGRNWNNVKGGVVGAFRRVDAMVVYNNELYVGGDFGTAGDVTAYYIAKWNGTDWFPVGDSIGMGGPIHAMVVDTIRNILYVAGDFYSVGDVEAFGIAQWDGNKWSSAGKDTLFGIMSMAIYHGDLYSGASNYGQLLLNGEITNNIFRWDGKEWHVVGEGANSSVDAMEAYHDTLFVGGFFHKVGNNLDIPYLAKWYSPDAYADSCGYNSSYCPKPNAGFNMNYTINDSTVYLTNATTGGCSYKWLFGDGDSATNLNPSHTYSDTGIFNITLFAHAGLRSDTFTSSVHIQVFPTDSCGYTVGNSPKPQAGFVMDSVNGFSVSFKNITVNGCMYKWHFGDGDTSTVLNPTHIYKDTGTYTVTLYAYSGDQSDTVSQPVIIYSTGMNKTSPQPNALEIIPNPSGQTVLFKYRIPSTGSVTLKITTLSGEMLRSYPLENSKTHLEISTAEFQPGLYLCSMVTDKGKALRYKKMAVVR